MKGSRMTRSTERSSRRRGGELEGLPPELRAATREAADDTSLGLRAIPPDRDLSRPLRASNDGGAPRSIVIVERDAPSARDLRSSLRGLGYDVAATAASASEALEAIERYQPDLVLMDVCLETAEDGIAAAAVVRAWHPTPIVFLAAQSDDATLMRAQEEAQPDGYVLRPYRDAELHAVVEVALQRHTLEEEMRQQRSLLAGVLGAMSDAVITADVDGNIVLLNAAGRRAFGEMPAQGGKATSALVYQTDEETLYRDEDLPLTRALRGEIVRDVELFIRSPEQPEGRWYSVNAAPLLDLDGVVCGAVGVGRDVSDLRAARFELQQLAQTDALTGAYNRGGFMQVARSALERVHRSGGHPAVFFIDLNGMKNINDSLGHPEGDRLLVDVASILRSCFRTSDIVGRIGGDEFVVLAPAAGPTADALRARLRAAVETFNARADRPYRISMSVGLCTGEPGKRTALEDLVAGADRHMYEDKLLRGARRRSTRKAGPPASKHRAQH